MGSSGTSLRVGSKLGLRIELEFGVQSCVTRSRNTNLPHSIHGMCHGLAYIILLYPCLGHNLAFICSVPSDPYVLFLEPHFYFISYVQPLCFPAVHLLCTIFIFCFLFQVMHSNHSSISKHVIFLLVLQYGNQLGQLLLLFSHLSDLLTSLC